MERIHANRDPSNSRTHVLPCHWNDDGLRQPSHGTSEFRGRAVAKIDPQTHVATIRPGILRDTFPNGVKITSSEVVKSETHFYLVRTGTDRANCQTTATPLNENQGTLFVAQIRGGGGLGVTTASCSGDPCSHCVFT